MSKKDFMLIAKIVDRAASMNLVKDRITHMMDIDRAHAQFKLRLEDWLNADDFNFLHDFTGIYYNMNRETGMCENFFVPRFASPVSNRK